VIEHWIAVASWAGRVARRGVWGNLRRVEKRRLAPWRRLPRLLRRFPAAGANGRVVYPSLQVYVGLQVASVGLGVLPVFVCLGEGSASTP